VWQDRAVFARVSVIGTAAALAACSIAAAEAPVEQLLRQTGAYVASFEQQIAAIVAEETYVQDSQDRAYNRIEHRELKSDFSLVRGDHGAYVEFRDVFSVDGRAIRDRQDRLTRLFLNPSASATEQLRAIVAESARYNIGRIERTLNTPMLPLLFVRTENQHGSVFTLTHNTTPELGAPPPEIAHASVLAFEEGKHNTLIRGKGGSDLPSRGRFWIEAETGRVLMTELLAGEEPGIRGIIDVIYQPDAALGVMVPAEMQEKYVAGGTTVTGRATYGRFRKFSVSTEETVAQPPRK